MRTITIGLTLLLGMSLTVSPVFASNEYRDEFRQHLTDVCFGVAIETIKTGNMTKEDSISFLRLIMFYTDPKFYKKLYPLLQKRAMGGRLKLYERFSSPCKENAERYRLGEKTFYYKEISKYVTKSCLNRVTTLLTQDGLTGEKARIAANKAMREIFSTTNKFIYAAVVGKTKKERMRFYSAAKIVCTGEVNRGYEKAKKILEITP